MKLPRSSSLGIPLQRIRHLADISKLVWSRTSRPDRNEDTTALVSDSASLKPVIDASALSYKKQDTNVGIKATKSGLSLKLWEQRWYSSPQCGIKRCTRCVCISAYVFLIISLQHTPPSCTCTSSDHKLFCHLTMAGSFVGLLGTLAPYQVVSTMLLSQCCYYLRRHRC